MIEDDHWAFLVPPPTLGALRTARYVCVHNGGADLDYEQ